MKTLLRWPCVLTFPLRISTPSARRGHVKHCFHYLTGSFALLLILLASSKTVAQITPHPVSDGNQGIPLSALVAQATAVFEGKALAQRSFWDAAHTRIYTATTVEVYKVFKGKVQASVEVVTEGGMTDSEAMGLVHGAVPLGDRAAGIFFTSSFQDPAFTPITLGQAYQVLSGDEGFFAYSGIPPLQNAADTPHLRYSNVESSLYPLLTEYTGQPYVELKPFDINLYNKVLERRGIDSQLQARSTNGGASDTKAGGVKKKASTSVKLSASPGSIAARVQAAGISSFAPLSVTAGTFTALTITGTGFGVPNSGNPLAVPEVVFTNPSNGRLEVFTPRENFRSWTNTQIVVDVPSNDGSAAPHGRTAGTGLIQVFAADGLSNAVSTTPVTVTESEFNFKVTTEYRQTRLVSQNGTGGVRFKYDASIYERPEAVRATERALRAWRCGTTINMGDDVQASVPYVQGPSECNIRMVPSNQMYTPTTGMETRKFYSFCQAPNNAGLFVYTTAIDIQINQDANWSYRIDQAPEPAQYDFKSVILHEIGHGVGLHHVATSGKVMFPSIGPGVETFTLQTEPELNAGTRIANRSALPSPNTVRTCTNTPSSYVTMTPLSAANCTGAEVYITPDATTYCTVPDANGNGVFTAFGATTSYLWGPTTRSYSPSRNVAQVTTSLTRTRPIYCYGTKDGLGDVGIVFFDEELYPCAFPTEFRTSAYPNPSTGDITVDYRPGPGAHDSELTLHNAQGTTLQTFRFPGNSQRRQFPIRGLAQGIYFLRTVVDSRTQSTIRLQVQ